MIQKFNYFRYLNLPLYKLQSGVKSVRICEKIPRVHLSHLVPLFCLSVFVILYIFLLSHLNTLTLITQLGCPKIQNIYNKLKESLSLDKCASTTTTTTSTTTTINETLSKHLPNCIIVGARKCGTRALLEFLDIHPQIRKVIDEVHFFDDDQKYNLGLEWYRQQMPLSLKSDIIIEKTPAYFITDLVPERIYAMDSKIKIILIVRDPVTRLISDYAQLASNKAKKDRKVESFEEVVLMPNGKINTNYKGIRISMYAVYFSRWIKLFPKSQIHVVDGDQFVYDPLPELKKIEQFLSLPNRISRDNFIYNVTKGFYCIRLNEDNSEKCLNKNKGRKHPNINPLLIRKLRKFYDAYNKYFYKLAGRKFSWPI